MTTLLPPARTAVEEAFEQASARLSAVPVPVGDLWDPSTCPAQVLPWLAWALSIDRWDPGWPEGTKRFVLTEAVQVHRQKGTVAAVTAALASSGYGDARIIERWGDEMHDGSITYDGTSNYAVTSNWASYRVRLSRAITIAQADAVRAILALVSPARCHLDGLDYSQALNIHNGAVLYDGTYSHGVA